MPDYSIPLQVNQPNTLGALGNLVNTAQGIQSFQSGAIQQQRLGINLQSEVQANNERKAVIAAMQSDPDLQADPTTGLIDPAKSTAKLQQLAPQTWSYYTGNVATSNQQTAKTNDMLIGLDSDAREALSRITASHVGQNDPSALLSDLQDWKANTKGPQAAQLANSIADAVGKMGNNPQKYDSFLQTASLRAEAVPSIIAARQAGTTLLNQGPQATPTVSQPNWSGLTYGQKAGEPIPLGAPAGWQIDSAGNLVPVAGFLPGKKTPGGPPAAAPASTSLPAPPSWMNKQQAANAADAQTRWSSAQTRDVDPASGYNATSQVYSNLKSLLDKNPNTGPGANAWNQFLGRIGTGTNHTFDPNTSYQEVAGYLDRLSAQNSAATGAATNFAREQQAGATGNPEVMGPTALAEKLRFGASVNEAAHAYASASRAFLTKQGANAAYANPQMFEQAWTNNASPIAFRLMADLKNKDNADFAATAARASPQDHQQYLNLRDYLLKGLLPPNG
jgi:hypothetical protein